MVTTLSATGTLMAQGNQNGFFCSHEAGPFASSPPDISFHFWSVPECEKKMVGNPKWLIPTHMKMKGSPLKVHFSSTQFVGGMQNIPADRVQPFESYRLVTEEGK